MIEITNINGNGWEAAIRGMRNPMNSWDKSDSEENCIGGNDLALMEKLVKAGSDHRKFLRFITVTMDINAPLYWWKEFDTYKVGTVANSCSTMHKIHAKEFTIDDFSHEHLDDKETDILIETIFCLNWNRVRFNSFKDKECWYRMIQLLPSSYNQKRTVLVNYEVLRNMYHSRCNHKLDEWRDFCEIIESLPYARTLICE